MYPNATTNVISSLAVDTFLTPGVAAASRRYCESSADISRTQVASNRPERITTRGDYQNISDEGTWT